MRLALIVVPVVLGVGSPVLAQGPPYGPEDGIPAAQQKQLVAMLDVVRNAQRFEALPVAIEGIGLSSTSHAVEKPVAVGAATGRALARILTRYDWTSWSASACMFDPAVAFRFTPGTHSTVVSAAKKAFPKQFDGVREENPDVKTVGQ